MTTSIELPRSLRHILVALALGWGLSSPASALTVPTGASVADLAAAVVADGLGADRLAGQAKSLLSQGVSAGDAVQALLIAGYGTFDVVEGVVVQGVVRDASKFTGDARQIAADDLVREVAARVFFVQGSLVRALVREAVIAAGEDLSALNAAAAARGAEAAARGAPAAVGDTAFIHRITGSVSVMKGEQRLDGIEGMRLSTGDRVSSLQNSTAVIQFSDGCSYRIRENELITVSRLSPCVLTKGSAERLSLAPLPAPPAPPVLPAPPLFGVDLLLEEASALAAAASADWNRTAPGREASAR
jgi:hypothetical protein